MDKHTPIDVSRFEAAAHPRSRKEFFRVLAAAGLGIAAGSTLLTRKASAQTYGASQYAGDGQYAGSGQYGAATAAGANMDLEILTFALANEAFEAEVFYPAALNAGILSGAAYTVVAQIQAIEVAHRDALAAAILSLGGTPAPAQEFMVPDAILADQQTFLEAALEQEIKDVGLNLGAAPMISSPEILAAAGAISGAEGENVVAVKNLLGVVPPANEAFPAAFTQDQVLAVLAPYMGMGTMPNTGGRPLTGGPNRAI
jgi:hypothetical protein